MASSTLELGSCLAGIRVELLLGRGGMSEVYLGRDEPNQRMVALKVIQNRRLDRLARVRFLREAQILDQLDHPDICRVYDLIAGPDAEVLVLELVEGSDLRQAMAGGLPYQEKLTIAGRIAGVLAVAHSHGIVHRDLKPENVMRTPEGNIKVLDFDLARPAHESVSVLTGNRSQGWGSKKPRGGELATTVDLAAGETEQLSTLTGSIVGTIPYMSPEQARGEPLTVASDLYSFGVLLHELFTGRPAYPGTVPMRTRLFQVGAGETEPVQGLEPELTELIEALKQLDPHRRPAAAELVTRLQNLHAKSR